MQVENIKTLSFGCRLNALETEKIQIMLAQHIATAIIVNTCAVTAEAERQSAQNIRRLARENENAPIFVTGCAATRNPGLFAEINNIIVISNADKLNLDAYLSGLACAPCYKTDPKIHKFKQSNAKLSKQFIQVQNGCNHICTYCVTRLLRGKNQAFAYNDIINDVKNAVQNGFYEIVLTGVDIASYARNDNGNITLLSDLCVQLLNDVPEIQRMRLSSIDPASGEIPKIIKLMQRNKRMLGHVHLSMQSGCDIILGAMGRRHTVDIIRRFVMQNPDISFSWDIICGFPGETDELFAETYNLVRELKPIKIHAFPFSPRPNTVAATLGDHVDRAVSKQRVKLITELADKNKIEFMKTKIGQHVQVLVEENNTARTVDDINVKIHGDPIPSRTICNLELIEISDLHFVGKVC